MKPIKHEEVKEYVDQGVPVYAESDAYVVIKDKIDQYLIKCLLNNHIVGLGPEGQYNAYNFYIKE